MKQLKGIEVLITGGSGFIGSHLTRRLIEEGARPVLVVRPESNLWQIKDIVSRVKLVKADITDYDNLCKAIKKINPKKIFHLAAYVDVDRSFEKSDLALKINTRGTINLLRALEDVNYDCFVNTGTCEEYGDGPTPFKENQPVSPVSPYSASKSAATLFCRMYCKTQNRPIITLRPFTTYGPGQGLNMFVSQVIVSALQKKDFKTSKGEQTREFNYVTDVVDGYIKASTSPGAIGEIINLGTGVECPIKDVAERIVTMMGNPIRIKFGALPYRTQEIWHLYCDNTKARKLLNWKPVVSLDEGLEKTIKWFSDNINLVNSKI